MADRELPLATVEAPPTPVGRSIRAGARAGFALGIIGAVIYLAGATLLPFSASSPLGPGSHTAIGEVFRYAQTGLGAELAALVSYLAIPFFVLAVSVAGTRDDHPGGWALALFGASSVWFLQVALRFVPYSSFSIQLGWVGFTVMDLGICVAFVGGVIAALGTRAASGGAVGAQIPDTPDARDRARGGAGGSALALGGVILYFAGSLLPFMLWPVAFAGAGDDPQAHGSVSRSLAHALTGGGAVGAVNGFLRIYGAASIVGILALAGLFGGRRDRWTPGILGASAAWSAEVVDTLISFRRVALVGLGVTQVAIFVALIGGILAVRGTRMRSQRAERGEVAGASAQSSQ